MNLEKVFERIGRADDEDLRCLARDLALLLRQAGEQPTDLKSVRAFLTALGTRSPHARPFAQGYLDALTFLLESYEGRAVAIRDRAKMIDLARTAECQPVLRHLEQGWVVPNDLAATLSWEPEWIVEVLEKMRMLGMVDAWVVEDGDPAGQPYILTLVGHDIAAAAFGRDAGYPPRRAAGAATAGDAHQLTLGLSPRGAPSWRLLVEGR